MKIIERIVNAETNEIVDIERDLNAQELAEWQTEQSLIQKRIAAQQEAMVAKAAAEAKLAALGLTADDLKALGLGGN
jgi:hypothetical protein